ncbi:hypothetical protein [Paenibacillus sp. GCM10027626]|uniref:hypothetical protein n=1 Tax=Paenibacillus sp. GCM10027626 TaxID=3273411 RepID=UPI00362D16F0
MDKRQVIAAYRHGIINVQECAQILGLDIRQLSGLMNEPELRLKMESQILHNTRSITRLR